MHSMVQLICLCAKMGKCEYCHLTKWMDQDASFDRYAVTIDRIPGIAIRISCFVDLISSAQK